MTLSAGDHLGAYEVLGTLGAGGMGEVYRARDTRLHREVAIKILPAAFANDAERVARFEREAQLLASLNHPNIAAIHGVEEGPGVRALILELVDGPTLADRIAQGALPLDDALSIAAQIAEALEAAHDRGIIHRDLKPANIKLTLDGKVKVLDFGLAKMLEAPGRDSALSLSPTLSVHATYAGVILGTAAYMSPEQARGKPIDRRTDVWGFGCVLFEMLTGQQVFDAGETVSDAVASVLSREPDWAALPPATPPVVRTLLRRCLQKDPRQRLPHLGVARLDLLESASQPPPAEPAAPSRRQFLPWAIAGVAVITTAAVSVAWFRTSEPSVVTTRSVILPPDENPFAVATPATRFMLAPDGRRLAFLATTKDGITRLWVRPLDGTTAQPLTGTENVVNATWSPDSRFLAFIANQVLKRVDAGGGPATTLAQPAVNVALTWSREGVILFAATARSALSRVPAAGGGVTPATTLDAAAGDTGHWMPFFLPDGRHFLYFATGSPNGAADARAVYVHALDSKEPPKLLLTGGSNAKYASGQLLFFRETTLIAQPFDVDRLELTGEPRPIAEQVQVGGSTGRTGAMSVSDNGLLVYQTGATTNDSQLTWVDTTGKATGRLGEPADYFGVEISPDGTKVLTTVLDAARRSRAVWIFDVARGLRSPLTFGNTDDLMAIWSVDGQDVIFNSLRQAFNLYRKPASGAVTEKPFAVDRFDKVPVSVSRDGKYVMYFNGANSGGPTGPNIWIVPASGGEQKQLLNTEFAERTPMVSPDSRWLAYVSNESGSNQVYVTSFPVVGGKWLVSAAGGQWPRWRNDGRALYYIGTDNRLMTADVDGRGEAFKPGPVTPLFEVNVRNSGYAGYAAYPYDVGRDGRLLLNVRRADATPDPLTLVTNWPELLKE